jgi:ABC-type polysaccharide/polyol phosphate transport system ATPase subunit
VTHARSVEFDHVWKLFRRGELHDSLRDLVPAVLRRLTGRSPRRTGEAGGHRGDAGFWALRDVSFRVEPGQTLGIIGHNGAGKSTILKILTGILRPTSGRTRVSGRIGALIEVASGFHPDLTGRENVFLQGAIMGMRTPEIRRRFDAIAAFSELEEFLDTPVKRYSTGMSARLGFSIAAHLEPEVLIIDEVLAVGDRAFQTKAFECIAQIARREDVPVVIVSHQLDRIAELCSEVLLLDHGRVVYSGAAEDTIAEYVRRGVGAAQPEGSATALALERMVLATPPAIGSGDPVEATLAGTVTAARDPDQRLNILVRRLRDNRVVYARQPEGAELVLPARGPFEVTIRLAAHVGPGAYALESEVWSTATRSRIAAGPGVVFTVRDDGEFFGSVDLEGRFLAEAKDALEAPA